MHWTQPAADLYDRWDFRSRLLAVLSKEAGAESCAVKVTHEMRENGYADAFNINAAPVDPSKAMYSEIYRKFDKVLQQSREDGAENPLLDATNAAFHTYFKQPDLIRTYGVKVLLNYIDNIVRCAKYYPTPGFSLQAAANQARAPGGECLVYEPAELPLRDEDLFRGNDYLRQAFEYTEMIHISKHCNHETGLAFQRKFKDLADDNNPFLALNFNEVRRAYQAQKGRDRSKNILRVMMELADIQDWRDPQIGFDFG